MITIDGLDKSSSPAVWRIASIEQVSVKPVILRKRRANHADHGETNSGQWKKYFSGGIQWAGFDPGTDTMGGYQASFSDREFTQTDFYRYRGKPSRLLYRWKIAIGSMRKAFIPGLLSPGSTGKNIP